MSLSAVSEKSDQELSSEEESDEKEQEKGVATARPPESGGAVPTIAATDVLDLLDQLVDENKISQERAVRLKRRYNHLLESIECSRATENSLLLQARELQQNLAAGQQVLEKAEGFPEADSSETSKLRQMLLQHNNDFMQCQERTARIEQELEIVKEEHHQVLKEHERMPKFDVLEEKKRALERDIVALDEEIDHKSSAVVQKLQVDIQKKEKAIQEINDDKGDLENMYESLQNEFVTLTVAPGNLPREIDRIKKGIQEAEEQITDKEKEAGLLSTQLSQLEESNVSKHEQVVTASQKLKLEQRAVQQLEIALDSAEKNMLEVKDQEAILVEERESSELQLRHRKMETKSLQDSIQSRKKEMEKELKHLKRSELQHQSTKQSLGTLRLQVESVQQQQTEKQHLLAEQQTTITGIRTDVEHHRALMAQQKSRSQAGEVAMSAQLQREQVVRQRLAIQQKEVYNLKQQATSLVRQRDQASRDYFKTKHQLHQATDELMTKDAAVLDHVRKLKELDIALKEFGQSYELVKTERNKSHSNIQVFHQVGAELREKLKVLQNEIEILRNSVDSKTKVLGKCEMALSSKVQDRDMQHQELGQIRRIQAELKDEMNQQRESLHQLTQQITATEQFLNRMRRYFEKAVQERNDLGLQVIERNEEVCVFHEKINVQDTVVKKGNMELVQCEEEMRFIGLELNKLKRDISICRHSRQEKEQIERELQRCQQQLLEQHNAVRLLEEAVADASNPDRIRVLPGSDPTCQELREKLEILQTHMTEYEQKLLEKELLLEQVSRLANRTQVLCEQRKATTQQIGSKVNSYQAKLRETSRKMMALVAELSVQQAQSLHLNQQVKERETCLEQAYTRLEAGEAPDEQTYQLWIKMTQKPQMTEATHQFPTELVGRELPNGVFTTAVSRHTAYIPESGELPIPRPYGALAPFKPSQLGSNMRHIRKPNPQPVDI